MKNTHFLTSIAVATLLFFTAVTSVSAETATVSATVPSSSFNAPVLLNPTNNATLNYADPTFSWQRPSPDPGTLHHYDLYIDEVVFAASVLDSLTSSDYYFYTASASSGTFYVSLKTDLSEGYHTWKVRAFDNSGVNSTSETRTLYIDTIPPYIAVTKVDKQNLTWNTSIPSSLPSSTSNSLNITTANPQIRGTVETNANLQLVLICPSGLTPCSNQVYGGNITLGSWQTTFYGLAANKTYTLRLSATDAGGNITYFPDFYITYGTTPTTTVTATVSPSVTVTGSPTPTPTSRFEASPSATPTEKPLITITPPPGLLNIITPTPFIPLAPSIPTPPPYKTVSAPLIDQDIFNAFLLVLLLIGLPTHLVLCLIGTGTPFKYALKFLYILALPFTRAKKYQTLSFSFIELYYPDKLYKPWQTTVSDINGFYTLKDPIPKDLLVIIKTLDKKWKNILVKGSIIPISCFSPLYDKPLEDRKKVYKKAYEIRIIPLILALLTGTTAFIVMPSYWILSYLSVSILYFFSEYIYPRISVEK